MAASIRTRVLRWMVDTFAAKWREQSLSTIESLALPDCGGIAFIGDSITAGSRWDLMFPDARTRNFGIGADVTADVIARMGVIVRTRPQRAFLLIGTNDLAAGIPAAEIATNVDRIIDELQGKVPSCAVHLQTVLPRSRGYAARIRELNRLYAGLAARRGIPLIDLYPLFDDGRGGIRQDLSNDGVHLLGAGYEVWRSILAPIMARS